jgi:hypothetical protein
MGRLNSVRVIVLHRCLARFGTLARQATAVPTGACGSLLALTRSPSQLAHRVHSSHPCRAWQCQRRRPLSQRWIT